MNKLNKVWVAATFLTLSALMANAQCVVINEVMINPSGAFDGSGMPNTSEWVELYNTCNTPVDLSCYVMTDGDWSVTFPAGSIIPANGYFTLGSNNAGFTPNLNWATCGCTSGATAQVGIFTNSAEQILLVNSTGISVDGVYWGAGQFAQTPSFTTTALLGCTAQTIPLASTNPVFHTLGSQSDGVPAKRKCDGTLPWLGQGPATPGASNNGPAPVPNFTSNTTSICAGSCVNFTDASTNSPVSWAWSIPSLSISSTTATGSYTYCFPTEGTYQVDLSITNACFTVPATPISITVLPVPTVSITPNTLQHICDGDSVALTAVTNGISLQWFQDTDLLPNQTNTTFYASEFGSYTVVASDGVCTATSNAVDVSVESVPDLTIQYQGNLNFCAIDSVLLFIPSGYTSYQWYFNDNPIANAIDTAFVAHNVGDYTVEVTNEFGCKGMSNVISTNLNAPAVTITPDTTEFCYHDHTFLHITTDPSASVNWYWNGFLQPDTLTTLLVDTNGVFNAVVTLGSCTASSDSINIIVHYGPTGTLTALDGTSLCNDATTTLVLDGNYAAYQWYENGTPITADTALVVSGSGSYFVEMFDAFGCTLLTDTVTTTHTQALISITADTTEFCYHDFTFLHAITDTTYNVSWYWNGFLQPDTTFDLMVDTNGVFTASITVGACTVISNAINIDVHYGATASITTPTDFILCNGETATMTLTGDFTSYLWYDNGTPFNQPTTWTVSEPGNYMAQLWDQYGCMTYTDSAFVLAADPTISITPSGNQTFCQGDAFSLTATSNGNIQWYIGNNPLNGQTQASLNPLQNGAYSAVAEILGCTSTSNVVNVTINPVVVPTISVADDNTLCVGETVVLNASGNLPTYAWYLDGNPLPNSNTGTFTASQAGVYTVHGTTTEGCTGISSGVTINVSIPQATITPNATVNTCDSNPIALTAGLNGQVPANYQWFNAAGQLNGSTAANYSATNTGVYHCVMEDQYGCLGTTADVAVNFNTAPTLTLTAVPATACVGQPITLTASGNFQSALWNTNATNTSIAVNNSGTYDVTVTSSNGCTSTASTNLNFTPLPQVSAGGDQAYDCSNEVTLSGSAQGTYSWSPSYYLSSTSVLNPTCTPTNTITYTLTATLNGCTNSASVTVYADCGRVFIPNIMTPNGDDKNDFFFVETVGVANFHLLVYNRYGTVVFESTDPTQLWDGKINGDDASNGTYYYTLEATDLTGKNLIPDGQASGFLELLR